MSNIRGLCNIDIIQLAGGKGRRGGEGEGGGVRGGFVHRFSFNLG